MAWRCCGTSCTKFADVRALAYERFRRDRGAEVRAKVQGGSRDLRTVRWRGFFRGGRSVTAQGNWFAVDVHFCRQRAARKNERDLVETTFRDHFDVDLRVVDASAQFLKDLEGVTEPQEKRRRIGHRFIEVFKEAAADVEGPVKFLAQGTLYPDVIESGHGHAGTAANIKLHHNVGGP